MTPHEYPRDGTSDSLTEDRVTALAGFGFTQRQREFLVTVMVHAGCFPGRTTATTSSSSTS